MNRKVKFASDELLTSPQTAVERNIFLRVVRIHLKVQTQAKSFNQSIRKESMLRFPILGKYADIRELNDVSSKQILNRISRRGGNSGMRRKRRCSSSSRRASYPTTQASSGHSTKRSGGGDPESVLQNTTPDLEKELPDIIPSIQKKK